MIAVPHGHVTRRQGANSTVVSSKPAGLRRRDLLARAYGTTIAAIVLNGCGLLGREQTNITSATNAPTTLQPRPGGTLRIGIPGDIVPTAVPHYVHPANYQLNPLIYDTLLSYDAHLNPQPALATNWTWSADFRRLTLTLRPDVRFHTGRPFTSQDAKSNLERLRNPAVSSQWRNYAELMHIDAPDAGTLVINYDSPLKSSLDALALTFMADPLTFDQISEGRSFVGTGPFRFREWAQAEHVAVERNPDYWQPGKPYLDGVVLRVLTNPATAVAALEADALDWLSGVPGQDAKRLSTDPSYEALLSGNGGTFFTVGFDVTIPELADRRVRQAFAYALNRPRLVEVALSGFGRPACIPWPRQSIGYDSVQDQAYSYDLNRARSLLQQAGWDTSREVPLLIPSFLRLTNSLAEILQADLSSVGVQAAVQVVDTADFTARGLKGQMGGAWITAMAFTNLSPATFLMTATTARVPNMSSFVTQRYTDLINQVVGTTDDVTLKATVHEVTQVMLDEAFILPFAEGAGQLAGPEVVHTRVSGAHWDGFGLFAYQDVWLRQ